MYHFHGRQILPQDHKELNVKINTPVITTRSNTKNFVVLLCMVIIKHKLTYFNRAYSPVVLCVSGGP